MCRASSKIQDVGRKTSWSVKMQRKAELASVKARNAATKEELAIERKERALRTKANRERRQANQLKSAQYQVISNTSKIRKLTPAQRKNFMKLADVVNS